MVIVLVMRIFHMSKIHIPQTIAVLENNEYTHACVIESTQNINLDSHINLTLNQSIVSTFLIHALMHLQRKTKLTQTN